MGFVSKRPLNLQFPPIHGRRTLWRAHGVVPGNLGVWAFGWEKQGSRFSLLQFVGCRGENLVATHLPSPPSGPPFLPGGKLGPGDLGPPHPQCCSLTGGGPAINSARNEGGVQRSRGGHGSFHFASMQLATQNTSCCSRLTPNWLRTVPVWSIWGEFLLEEGGRAPARIGRFQKEPPSQLDPCGSST